MTASITAGARTLWAPRHGVLEHVRSEELLAAALSGVVANASVSPEDVKLLLVACDTGVGAQGLNVGRRTASALGWDEVPALTVDGQGVGDLGLLGIAASLIGNADATGSDAVVVAAVDSTTTVPPGAGLVRDYGRPTIDAPRQLVLEQLAREAGLTRADLDTEAQRVLQHYPVLPPHSGMVPVGAEGLRADVGVEIDLDAADLLPLNGDDGLITAYHEAPLADGAAAVVVQHRGVGGRELHGWLQAHSSQALVGALRSIAASEPQMVLADPSMVTHCLVAGSRHDQLAPVRAVGNTPSANGLRMVVDALHLTTTATTVVSIGEHGQLGRVTVGPADGLP